MDMIDVKVSFIIPFYVVGNGRVLMLRFLSSSLVMWLEMEEWGSVRIMLLMLNVKHV